MRATAPFRKRKQSAAPAISRGRFLAITILFLVAFVSLNAAAQKPPQRLPPTAPPSASSAENQVTVRLRNENESQFDMPAIIWLRSLSFSVNSSNGALSGEAVFRGVRPGQYTVEAEAPGYATARETIELMSPNETFFVTLYMRPEPAANTVASPPGPPVLAPKARQEVEKGLQALQTNNLAKARKHLEAALRLAPGHPDVNYLFGTLSLQANDLAQAKLFLEKAVALDPKHRLALVALSGLHYRQQEYTEAIRLLERALELDRSSWRVHWLMASAYLQQGEFEKARVHAEHALKSGKEKAGEAQLLLGQALAGLGEKEKASQALESFLRDYPTHKAAEHARRLLAAVRQQAEEPLKIVALPILQDASTMASLPLAPLALPLLAARWAPADVDAAVPAVAPNTPCSMPDVLSAAGQRARELVINLQQFTATEWLEHEQVTDAGDRASRETRTFTYLATIQQIRPGMLSVEEYRNGTLALEEFPARLATLGLSALALIFHPYYVGDFEMTCEGLGQWRGQPAWQIHFRQRDDRPSRIRTYRVKQVAYPVKLKGRAWIAAGTHQVVRLETDLAEGIPAIRLGKEHLLIEYRPVPFQNRRVELWLPESAELYLDFQGRRYHRRHSFGDFLLFSVETTQQIRDPQNP